MDLLWEWWVTTTQALVDTIGPERALVALRPYYRNSNSAAMHILKDYFHDIIDDPDVAARVTDFVARAWLGVDIKMSASEDGYEDEMLNCKTKGECPVICQLCCKESIDFGWGLWDIAANAHIEKSLSKGDDHCHKLIRVRDREGTEGEKRSVRPIEIDPEELTSFSRQYVAETWVMTTRACLDTLGSEASLAKLRMYMRHSGLVYGMQTVESRMDAPKDVEFLGEMIGVINDSHLRKGKRICANGMVEEEVVECPFAQAPPEVCLQYEAFFRGICEAVNPEYQFVYDRMMTKGDDTCHWTIRKKGEHFYEIPNDEATDDPVKMLAKRYVNGEISR